MLTNQVTNNDEIIIIRLPGGIPRGPRIPIGPGGPRCGPNIGPKTLTQII